jgi:hypothetical protein
LEGPHRSLATFLQTPHALAMTQPRLAMSCSQLRPAFAALAIISCCELSSLASDVAQAPSPEQVQLMIDGLGHDSFIRREQAMQELIAAGIAVEKEVTAAVSDGDPEVRYRAAKVLREIEKSQIAERRLRFIEGDTAAMKMNAASWQRLAEVLGNTRESRELFVQMQTDGGALLDQLEADPARCAGEIAALYQKDMFARRGGGAEGIKPGLVLAMVFAAGEADVTLDAASTSRAVSLLYRFQGKFAEDNEPFRTLLGRWMDKKGTDINSQFQFLRLAQQFKLPQGLALARTLVASAPHAAYKAQAVMTVAQLGGAEDIPSIEKMIGDNTSLGAMGVKDGQRKECKLGDVALAMCIVLSEQKVKDFGFEDAPEGKPLHASYIQYSFTKEEARAAARAKWEEFRKAQATK